MRLAIIGCGLIGKKRAEAAKGHQVALCCDLDLGRAEALASRFGAKATSDWKQAVNDPGIDAVIAAVTHDQLPIVGLAAVEAGKPTIIEKPAGRNAAELAPVAAAAKAKGLPVKVGYNHRFHPAFLKAREIFESGALGPMMFIRARYGHGGRVGYEQEWRFNRELSGGGELIDQGSHLVDLSRWFLGELTLDYAALPTSYWDAKVEDNCFLALKNQSGAVAWLHASWSEWKNLFCFEIYGRDGKLVIDGLGGSYGVEKLTYYRMLPEMGPPETTSWEFPFPDLSWEREFAEFAAAVAEKRRPLGDVEDALAVLTLIDQAYRKSRP
jgi:predicted dehydrogenase